MKLRVANFVLLAALSLAASLTVILGRSPSESGQILPALPSESGQPSPSERDRQALVGTVLLRTTAKHRIARDVIAGRLSLAEAAALVGELNRVPPKAATLRFRFPACSDEELLCRQVIEYVRAELDGEPDRQEATLAQLEADFKELQKNGALPLPNLLILVPAEELLAQARVELTDQGVLPPAGVKSSRLR
jgi:hypothetical protein